MAADKARSAADAQAAALLLSIKEEGLEGVMEHPVLDVLKALLSLNRVAPLQKLLDALAEAAEAQMAGAGGEFASLMVLNQLGKDLVGPAAPPEGSPLEAEYSSLVGKLRAALLVSLHAFPRRGSPEAKRPATAVGMLVVLWDKLPAEDSVGRLCVEASMLRLLMRAPSGVPFLRGLALTLRPLQQAVEELADYEPGPDEEGEAEEDGDEGAEEEDEEDAEGEGEEGPLEDEEEEEEQEADVADGDEDGDEDGE